MKILLDTNIIIHREANRVIREDIGYLFRWFDELKHDKYIHPLSVQEIEKHKDKQLVASFKIKLQSYYELKTQVPDTPEIQAIRAKHDNNDNDMIDTSLLSEVFGNRVDILISEDKKIHKKATELGIQGKVFTIEAFLEKCVAENPTLVDYNVLSVKKEHFGNININDSFFDSFKEDYPGFEAWFNRKADEIAYICTQKDKVLAFLYVKVEGEDEDYSDVEPPLPPKRRLKIGTFKVTLNGFKLGERFLKIIFDNALNFGVDEIYVTIFDRTEGQERLIDLLAAWGFEEHGIKHASGGDEFVYKRDFRPAVNIVEPSLTYPYISNHTKKFIVPIYPQYHTELLPDSYLRTESPEDYIENRPNRNAVKKVYISRSYERSMQAGDIIVFYRTKHNGKAYYTSVATTIGVVESVTQNIPSLEKFIELCRSRSVFDGKELTKHWDYQPANRPFVVKFLYIYSFPNRLNLEKLLNLEIITKAPRGFELLNDNAFDKLMENSNADQHLIVD